MVTQLSAHLGADFLSIQNMLASISALTPPVPASVPPALAMAPPNPPSIPFGDDEMLGEEDFDFGDF